MNSCSLFSRILQGEVSLARPRCRGFVFALTFDALVVAVGSLALLSPRSTFAAPQASTFDYVTAVNRANALKKSGQFERAIAIYVDVLAHEQAQCLVSPPRGRVAQLPESSPCWHMMKIQFNLGITRRDQGKPTLAAKAFASYLSQWHALFPNATAFPWEERAHFEIAQANFARKRWSLALEHYRSALTRWKARHPKRRPRFEDIALRRLAESLEFLSRRAEAAAAYEAFLRAYQRAHGLAHADRTYLRRKIAALRSYQKPTFVSAPREEQRSVVDPPRSTTWLVMTISSSILAVASAGLAVGYTLWANDTFNDLPEFGTRRDVAIAGYVVSGLAALGAVLSYYAYVRSGREKDVSPRSDTGVRLLAGPSGAALRWLF